MHLCYQAEYLDSGIDNIEVDPATGDLWIGSHAVIWKILDMFGILGGSKAPCQVHCIPVIPTERCLCHRYKKGEKRFILNRILNC